MRKKEEYLAMVKFAQVGGYNIIEPASSRANRMLEADADEITASLEFRAAEIARERYERAKQYRKYDVMRKCAELADMLYRSCYTKIALSYAAGISVKKTGNYFDITPLGILQDEIEFAISTLRMY